MGRPADVDASVQRAAMAAAGCGFFVFPTRLGGKEPRAGLSWPRAACNDPARLRRATWHRGENYGVAAKPSGLVAHARDLGSHKDGCRAGYTWLSVNETRAALRRLPRRKLAALSLALGGEA